MNQALVAPVLGVVLFDRLDHAERGAVTHAEDDVGVGGELLLGDPLGAGGVVVGGLADHAVEHLGVWFRRLETFGETDRHVVPGRRLAGDDHPDCPRLRRLAGQHTGEVGDFLGLGLDVATRVPARRRPGFSMTATGTPDSAANSGQTVW